MKNKILPLMVLSILSMVTVLGIASADMGFNQTSINSTIVSGQTSVTFNFKLNNTGTTNYSSITWTGTSNVGAWSLPATLVTLNESVNQSVSATLSSIPSTFTGLIMASIMATASGGFPTDTLPIWVNVTPGAEPVVCDYGNPNNNLRVKKISFTNAGFSETEFGKSDEWFPIDSITAEMTIENKGNEKVQDIEVNWGLYDPSSKNWVIDLTDEKTFSLSHDKNKVITVDFSLDNADMDLSDLNDGDYVFYVQASGYDNEYSEDVCTISSKDVKIIIETDFVVLDKIVVPETNSCGADFLVSANVWNIGEDDQSGVYVNIYNKELNIDQDVKIGDINAFDYEKLDATIAVPKNVTSKTYNLVFSVYDENDDIYVNDYSDDDSIFSVPLKVTCTGSEDSTNPIKAVVSASLESGGKAGEDLVVKATITNLESRSIIYTASASSYGDWASSAMVDQGTFTLASGESKSILFTFVVKKDAQGDKTFNLELASEGKLVTEQPVSVTIEKTGFSLSQFWENNNYIWAIAFVNILLVVVIIIVAVKVMRK